MQATNDIEWMNYALMLAERAEAEGEIPVGAVIVLDNQMIGEGWNRSIISHDPTAHAEIMALRQAGSQQKNYRLNGATLYVTLEPCIMCIGAIIHSRIARLVYGACDYKTGAVASVFPLALDCRHNHIIEVVGGVAAEACGQRLSAFFKRRREEKKLEKNLRKLQS